MTDIALILVIVLVLVLIWRGPKTLPVLGQALGRGVKEARKEAGEFREGTEPAEISTQDSAGGDATAIAAAATLDAGTPTDAGSPPPPAAPPTT